MHSADLFPPAGGSLRSPPADYRLQSATAPADTLRSGQGCIHFKRGGSGAGSFTHLELPTSFSVWMFVGRGAVIKITRSPFRSIVRALPKVSGLFY